MENGEWSTWKPVRGFWSLFGWRWYREKFTSHVGGDFADYEWSKEEKAP